MLLNFIKVDFRTKVLVEKYPELISEGVKPSEILVLVQNSTLKKQFVNKILENLKINAIEKLNVHSFFSIVYNTLVDNWCFIENSIPGDKRFILPNLVGLEVSQFLLKDILKQVPVKGYNSKKSLLHQIFRRYALIVQNHLTNEDVKERSKILKESFADDAEIVIKRLLGVTLKSRSLDYLRQTLIFNYVYKNTDYFKNIKYLLVDDADEMTPVCFDFITYLRPQLKDWVICFDSLGSSRCGYLSADTSIEYKLKKLFNEEVISQQAQNYPPLVGGSKSPISGRGLNECGVSAPDKKENCWEFKANAQIKDLTPLPNLAPSGSLPQGERECARMIKARHFYTQEALNYSKELRQNQTPAEEILWYYLRKKQLGGLKFRRQEAFGNYILDFVCYEKKLVIELDGGGHLETEQTEHDKSRDKFIMNNGFRVLRVFNNDVFNNIEGVIEEILRLIEQSPLLQQAQNYPPLVGADLRTDWGKYESPDSERMEPAKPHRLEGDTPGAWSKSKTGSKSLISGRGLNECGVSAPDKNKYSLEFEINAQIKNLTPLPNPLPQGERECRRMIKARHFYTQEALNYSKELRQNQTPAEEILWYYLRKKQLGGLKFRRQEAFGNYILDFVCYEKKLVIELDGGGHLETEQTEHDKSRDKFIMNNGFRVLRVFNNDVFNNIEGVIEEILRLIEQSPLLQQAQNYPPLVGGSKSSISGRGLSEYGVSAPDKNKYSLEFEINAQIKDLTPPPSLAPSGSLPQGAGGCAQEFSSFRQGEIIFSNIIENKKERLENFTLTSLSKRAEILDYTVEKIQNLFKKDVLPKDIAIITPLQDDMLHFALKENLKCNLLFLSGSEKLVDNPLVKSSLNILKLMLNLEITEMDLRVILADFAGIPLKYCNKILEYYKLNKKLPAESEFYNEKYKKFHDAFENVRNKNEKLSKKVFDMFYSGIDFVEEDKINKFNFFIKQLKDFENVLGGEKVIERAEDIIVQIENSIIAENPSTTLEIGDNDLVVATPQKIIDNKISTRYQFWLDVSHSDWVKTDTGPLYNAWVMQADWTKNEYTVEDDIFLSKQKTARILRKLLLLAGEHIWACSSLFDPSGVENLGGIEEYLAGGGDEPVEEKKAFRIIPRDDQKPVLDYRKGSMAISAVPGAGKTTILLALIIKLMDRGVNPENIYVLTYMDSAARNFRERIKNMCPNTNRLPNISTIHGLALKIIKENSNFERLNLSSDFEICDDTQRMRIIKAVGGKSTKTEIEEFDRAISVLKLQEGNIDTKSSDKKTEKFKTFYKEYQAELREANLIDYDDILIMSVKLLENNPDILKYYQNQCEYIIEDEAQDSSGVQQRLIALLSGKHKNLIRCGDINQAITTTFSNADVEGFRAFIHNADKTVEMNHSQRCTQEVMDLANKLVDFGDKILPKAFFKSYMHGVSGKNPESKNAIYSRVFENIFAERNFVLKEIKNILTKNKDATIGILLRNNYQVNSWAEFINNAGLKTITRNDSLSQKGVFNTIFSILKFIQNPYDNEILVSTYETLSDLGFYKQRLQLEIRASEIPFIQKDGDDIESQDLSQFLWDMQYWLNSSTLPLEELVIKIGLFYYTSDIEKSNVYLIATLVKRLNSQGKFDLTLQRLEELSKKPTLSGFKFFSDEEDKDAMRGKVQIMTLHKSKGDEFEYVFLPEMAEKNLSIDVEKQNIKSSTLFMEEVKSFNPNYKRKSELELRQFNSEESLRLLYVAITRAQKKLYITTSAKAKGWGNKETTQEPSIIFGSILSKN